MKLNSQRARLELQRAQNPFLWLVFAILTTIIAMVIVFGNLNFIRPFEDRYVVDVAFDSVKGLRADEHPVRIAGVVAGLVTGTRTEDGVGIATLSFEPQYAPLYKDAELRIRPQTPLQDMYVTVEDRGTEEAGELAAGDPPIRAKQTVTPVDISRVFATFDEDTQTHLNTLLDQLATGLAGNGKDLRFAFAEIAPFLHAAEDVTSAMSERDQELRRVITNFTEVADLLAERDQQLNALVVRGDATLTELAAVGGPLAQSIAELPPTMDAIRSSFASLRAAEADLDPALRSLRPVADELEDGLEGLEDFSEDATPALRDLRPAMSELRPLSESLRPTAASLEGALERLRVQAPRFDGITQTAERCLDTSLSRFFQDSLSVLKIGDSIGAIPRSASSGNLTFADKASPLTDPNIRATTPCYEGEGADFE
ncbi:MAG: hypothetical protein H0U42_05240 [Thermoleophilaceae bacterium]|nr:hypothetical protein [Thermoleophilaceae bacterium]